MDQDSVPPAFPPAGEGSASARVPAAPWWDAESPQPPLVEPLPEASAARVILAAAAAGLLAQLLFVDQRLGVNVVIWSAVVLGATVALRRSRARLDPADRWLPPAALLFAGFVALRDELALLVFDVVAAGGLTLAAVLALGGTLVTRRSWAMLATLGSVAVAVSLTGATRLGSGLRPLRRRVPGDSIGLRIARGLLLALPLIVVFVALFSAADAVFAAHLRSALALELDAPTLVRRVVIALVAAWLFAGTMAVTWLHGPSDPFVAGEPEGEGAPGVRSATLPRLGLVEALVVLVALDVVFTAFVVLQAAYLFGGVDTLSVSGMTYSEYARRGFFELIAVAVLSSAVLLVVDRLTTARHISYVVAAVALVTLTGVVLVSAAVRLGLYQAAYGWTELRFYALGAIIWLGSGLLAMAAAFLADRVSDVPRWALATGLVVAVGVNLIGPQWYVTTANVQRTIHPELVPPDGSSGLDLEYIGYLGDDAVPALVGALPRLPDAERDAAEALLRRRASLIAEEESALGWPSWNLARARAIEALRAAGYLHGGG